MLANGKQKAVTRGEVSINKVVFDSEDIHKAVKVEYERLKKNK
jgi:hypothetical protein